jgi:putative membrane-bound dehydrogenase-like protein
MPWPVQEHPLGLESAQPKPHGPAIQLSGFSLCVTRGFQVTCHNCRTECKRFGKDRNGHQRYRCRLYLKTFTEPHERAIETMYVATATALMVLRLLVKGNSIRSTERITNLHRDTILKLLVIVGKRCDWLTITTRYSRQPCQSTIRDTIIRARTVARRAAAPSSCSRSLQDSPAMALLKPTALPAVALLLLSAAACSKKSPPFSPKDALETIHLDPAWRVDLFASEPMFADPVAMDIDEDGRIYVVQDSGYPLDTEDAVGKVWLLEDTNGDGKPDKSTLFAEKLVMPTGVMRWKKGILVTDAPNLWYLEDTNGDGKADIKKAILTGFAFTNPQHTVNSPTYGLDNWIYLAHEGFASAVVFARKFGDMGSDIRFVDRPGAPSVKNERRNVRFRPDTNQLETTSSTSQFGISFDDYGHLLTVNNSNHAREEVLAARYLTRNPDLLAGSTMQDVSDHGAAAQVFSIVKNPRFELLSGAGIFTSACGITWFHGGTFVAEPVHGLVHRDNWIPNGATYTAKRARENVEFLASTDNWFRPVNFYIGPDDALYLIDYYRKVIEHPEWTSREVYESKDIYDGKDLGRIYRLTQTGAPSQPFPRLRLSQASDEELVRKA